MRRVTRPAIGRNLTHEPAERRELPWPRPMWFRSGCTEFQRSEVESGRRLLCRTSSPSTRRCNRTRRDSRGFIGDRKASPQFGIGVAGAGRRPRAAAQAGWPHEPGHPAAGPDRAAALRDPDHGLDPSSSTTASCCGPSVLITLLVLALLVIVMVRFNAKREPDALDRPPTTR